MRVDYESPASMKKEQLRDLCISSAVRQLQRGGSIKSGPYWRYRGGMSISPNGLLMKGKRVVVPRQIQQQVIIDYHGQNYSGVVITTAMIKERFRFKAIGKQVKEWIDDCQTCSQVRNENDNKAHLVVKDDEDKPWEVIAMDVGTMPESSRNNKYFLLVVDHSSKFSFARQSPCLTNKLL